MHYKSSATNSLFAFPFPQFARFSINIPLEPPKLLIFNVFIKIMLYVLLDSECNCPLGFGCDNDGMNNEIVQLKRIRQALKQVSALNKSFQTNRGLC